MILFVVNESSGNGRGRKIWRQVKQELRRRSISYRVVAAATEAESARQTKAAIDSGDLKAIAIIGGDGSLHSLLPHLAGSGIPIGLIPSGSGNDNALTFGIPRNPMKALDIVLNGQPRAADLIATIEAPPAGAHNTPHAFDSAGSPSSPPRYSSTAIAVGLDGAVADDVNRSRYKRWCNRLGVGSLAYLIGLLRMLAVFKPQRIAVTVDGERREFERGWLVAIASHPTYGGGLRICPDARADDGELHVCVVHDCSALRILSVFPTILNGSHVKQPYVAMLRGKSVLIEAPRPLLAFGDGEPVGRTTIRADVHAGQLLFLTAASG
ncbi:diacylglycerol/lipid kinase family protein [Cohnella faecalis]|uniref:diacylglycerol/lipid kinase family protein n=1 Tax=Cohnella faecalis TaxID=2315694 RepID=UPI0013144EB1|nr:diacylglycerol kinase family protein [Cohnella faecalis]